MCEHTENVDYNSTASPTSGAISAFDTRSTHTFAIIDDNNIESPETFLMDVIITGTTPLSLIATANPNRATVRIIDDDGKL